MGEIMKARIATLIVAIALFASNAQAAFATTQYYHFDDNIPATSWRWSSYKSLPADRSFRTTLLTCIASDGSGQGASGVLMKPQLSSGATYAYKKVLPGYQYFTLLAPTATSRTVRIGLQSVGTTTVDATGYWYF